MTKNVSVELFKVRVLFEEVETGNVLQILFPDSRWNFTYNSKWKF